MFKNVPYKQTKAIKSLEKRNFLMVEYNKIYVKKQFREICHLIVRNSL